jgi:hypothetical protein
MFCNHHEVTMNFGREVMLSQSMAGMPRPCDPQSPDLLLHGTWEYVVMTGDLSYFNIFYNDIVVMNSDIVITCDNQHTL